MTEQIKSPFTPKFVLLDIAGMFFLGIGLAKQFAGFDFLPQLAGINYGYAFIALGAVLMTLAVRQLLKNIKPGQ